jgi:protease-4
MARKRDIAIAVIIIFSFIIGFGFMGLVFLGALSTDGEVSLGGFGEKIAVIEIYGAIYDSADIIRQLKRWGENDNVKAIILHIDSPGGAAAPFQEVHDEILRLREEEGKIVVASCLSIAASGGYMTACACDVVVCNPGAIIGSIGVIIQYMNAEKLLKTIGISFETVKSGELKDVGSRDRAMTENERKMLTSMVMDTYEQFVETVANGRDMSKEDVYPLADGSVFSGRQAYELGLVDTLGCFEDAVRFTAELAGIEGEPNLVKAVKPKPSIFDFIGTFMSRLNDLTSGAYSQGPRVLYLY